jgi:hypothetical protein
VGSEGRLHLSEERALVLDHLVVVDLDPVVLLEQVNGRMVVLVGGGNVDVKGPVGPVHHVGLLLAGPEFLDGALGRLGLGC